MTIGPVSRADWPTNTVVLTGVGSSVFPIEAAIRNTSGSSSYGDVWIAYTLHHWTGTLGARDWTSELFLRGFPCGNTQYRVYAKWRCGSGSAWTTEIIRTNTNPSQHQSMAYGRPGLVLNNVADVAHVVLLDGLNREETDDPANTNDLYWYRKPYVCAL